MHVGTLARRLYYLDRVQSALVGAQFSSPHVRTYIICDDHYQAPTQVSKLILLLPKCRILVHLKLHRCYCVLIIIKDGEGWSGNIYIYGGTPILTSVIIYSNNRWPSYLKSDIPPWSWKSFPRKNTCTSL